MKPKPRKQYGWKKSYAYVALGLEGRPAYINWYKENLPDLMEIQRVEIRPVKRKVKK